ncbi:fumarylacetoacetate hydrolase family protein [Phytohabitans sp. ZYX-F-186]|uniref:Fumarylacetoacetate hydrolase family protein n=1 Tax=Phytohabitans maris TaxID=3071409 RepID=A0ABU0ZQS6_9ACTN|nr:fumarylacetoacetate hydrolase family protein [Phytohabitans sp. ZYX-F-186]MDQ7908272.1 fumarylacetoacetate hydrolase family protein [Phytohabitans sp. ZYX-F-186]
MSLGSPAAVRAAADRLSAAAATGTPCAPIRDLIGPGDVATAYRVQRLVVQRRLAAGARVAGRKIGLTSAAVRRQLGVDSPDFGVLLDDMAYGPAATIPMSRLLQPRIEAEIAFRLGADLAGGRVGTPFTVAEVRAAVAYAAPALEVCDSRVAGWDISLADTVADNASSGLYVLGEVRRPLNEFEPVTAEMRMTVDGEVASTGSGAACLGDPLAAVAWLATTARDLGSPLVAGQVVLSGALGPMVPVAAGNQVRARITGLGSVSVAFDGGDGGER